MIDIEKIRIGDLLQVNKDGLCIKKGTIVEIRGIHADDTLPAKGLTGSLSCRPLDDTQFDGGIWAAYLDPIPLTPKVLTTNGFKLDSACKPTDSFKRYIWVEEATRLSTYQTIISVNVYTPPIGGVPFLVECSRHSSHEDGINDLRSCDVATVHELRHLAQDCGIELHVKP